MYTTDSPQTLSIRPFIFLMTGLCAGLPALVWAVRSLRQHQARGGRVSAFVIILLFTDVWEQLLTPFMLHSFNFLLYSLGNTFSIKVCGFCLHQLVALERILSLRYPLCSSRLSSPLVSIPLSLTIMMCAHTLVYDTLSFWEKLFIIIVLSAFTCIVAVTTCILACKTYFHTSRRPGLDVLFVAIFSLIICLPSFLPIRAHNGAHMFYPITSLRLIADPLQCVLVCRETSRRQPLQTVAETDSDQV